MAFFTCSPVFRRSACRALSLLSAHVCLLLSGDHEELFQSRPVAGSRSVEARMERRLEEMGRFYDYRTMHIGADP